MGGNTGEAVKEDDDGNVPLPTEPSDCESSDDGEEITDCSNVEYIDSTRLEFLR